MTAEFRTSPPARTFGVLGAQDIPTWLDHHLAPLRAAGWELRLSARDADALVVLDADLYWGLPGRVRRRAVLADPLTVPAASDTVDRAVTDWLGLDADAEAARWSARVEALGADALRILGPGPVDVEALQSDTPTLLIGSTVFDAELMARVRPVLIAAADGGSQLGGSPTARLWTERVQALLRHHADLHLVVPAHALAQMRHHWPDDLLGRIIGVPEARPDAPALPDAFAHHPTGNVLTSLALPVAAGVVAGSDTPQIDLQGITVGGEPPLRFDHRAAAERARRLGPIRQENPAGTHRAPDHMARHLTRLEAQLAGLAARGVDIRVGGRPWGRERTDAPAGPSRLMLRVFDTVDRLQHREGFLVGLAFAIAWAGLLGARAVMPTDILIAGLLAALVAGLVALALFLRARGNRLAARTERHLSERMAQMEAETDARLRALEERAGLD